MAQMSTLVRSVSFFLYYKLKLKLSLILFVEILNIYAVICFLLKLFLLLLPNFEHLVQLGKKLELRTKILVLQLKAVGQKVVAW